MTSSWLRFVLCLLTGAFLITFSVGCPEIPGDDDTAGDDDASSDDDDTTGAEFAFTANVFAPNGLVCNIEIVNDESLATCQNAEFCSATVPYPDEIAISCGTEGLQCFDKIDQVSAEDNGFEADYTYDFYDECALSPEGQFQVYDKPCDDPTKALLADDIYEVSVYNDNGRWRLGNIGMPAFVNGNELTNDSNITGTISDDLTEIYITNGYSPNWLCQID